MSAYRSEPLHTRAEQQISGPAHRALEEFFTTARQGILGTTTADAQPSDLPPNLSAWPDSSVWEELVRRFIAPAIRAAFDMAFDAAARSDALQIHRHRQTFMDQVYDRLSLGLWEDGTFERIRGDLSEGLDAGESVTTLRERISDQLNVNKHSYIADRIARTESHTAVEGGTWSAMVAWEETSGEIMYQQWIATPGPRTRPSHLTASGQRVRLTEPFRVGGEDLQHPGDPSGPARETINCRCSTLTGTLEELDDLSPSPADTRGSAMPVDTTSTEPSTDPDPAPLSARWRGVLAPLNVRGDYRVLAAPRNNTPLTSDHMWLSWQERSAPGHDGKVSVGVIDRVWVHDDMLWGEGRFDLEDETGTAPMVARKVRDGFAGTVSIDQTDLVDATLEYRLYDRDGNQINSEEMDFLDLVEGIESGDLRELLYISDWRLGGATLVQDPAFHTSRDGKGSAFIESVPEDDQDTVTAAAIGDDDLPISDRDTEWDGSGALRRLQDADALNTGCFWRSDDADADSTTQADYKLPFADVFDGQVRAVPAGIFAVAGVLQGARGGADIPEDDQDTIREQVSDYYERMRAKFNDDTIVPPWEDEEDTNDSDEEDMAVAAVTAAAGIAPDTATWAEQVAGRAPMEPDPTWFHNPNLTGPTKVRVTDEGRVYGHVACWSTGHIGYSGQDVRPPRSHTNYGHYRRNRVRCSDGSVVFAGTIVMGTGHADLYASPTSAMEHYDDTGYAVSDVVCGEDDHGIWFSGALKPGVSALQVLTLDRYSLSGDWRNGELVGVCVVNVPGFPISDGEAQLSLAASGKPMESPRPRARQNHGEQMALVASGVVTPKPPRAPGGWGDAARIVQEWTKSIDARMEAWGERLREESYQAGRRAAAEAPEMRNLAREINAPSLADAHRDLNGGS